MNSKKEPCMQLVLNLQVKFLATKYDEARGTLYCQKLERSSSRDYDVTTFNLELFSR